MATHDRALKILHIVEHGITLNSGYGFRSVNIFQAQRERGWHPVVLTFPEPNESGKGDWKRPDILEGVTYYYRPLLLAHGRFSFLDRRGHRSTLARRIQEIVAIEKPDVLHAHSPVINGLVALQVGRKFGIPVVYEIRSLWEEAAVAHGNYGYQSRRFKRLRALETWVCRNANHVVAISSSLKNHLLSRGIPLHKISVVSNGVDLNKITSATPDAEYKENWRLTGKEVIGYVGSFRSYEGLDLLVRAVARLSKTRPDMRLLLVGGGRTEVELGLHALVDELELRERVIISGWIPQERIPGVYALTDILVYPRKRLPLTELITPLKPLEAMAAGKALIASDVGGHRELIQAGYNGLLFHPGSESALEEAITRLLDNHALRCKLGTQAATWVRRERSWNKTASIYSEIYRKAWRRKSTFKSIENVIHGKKRFTDLTIVCNTLRWGGISRVVCTLCNAWSLQGHKVYLITLKSDDSFFYLEPSIHRIDAANLKKTRAFNMVLRRLAALWTRTSGVLNYLPPLKRLNTLFLWDASPWLLPRVGPLRTAIRRTDSSIVISFGSVANVLTILACRKLDRKIIISERNDVGQRPLAYPWEHLRQRLYNRADVVTANTKNALRTMQAYVDKEKLTFVPNPIFTRPPVVDPPQGSLSKTPFVLVVANLNFLKAHDVLLQAFSSLSPELSKWRLAIVGDGELEQTLRERANVLGIGDRVDWYGLVRDPFVFYRAASVFALPSQSEGMPNALMEAMSCGLPVIVSNASSGFLDLVKDGETGLVVPVGDFHALAQAIERLAQDSALRRRLGDAARRKVSEYNLPNVMAIWERIISSDPTSTLGTERAAEASCSVLSSRTP